MGDGQMGSGIYAETAGAGFLFLHAGFLFRSFPFFFEGVGQFVFHAGSTIEDSSARRLFRNPFRP
jgi:hypothetical protein